VSETVTRRPSLRHVSGAVFGFTIALAPLLALAEGAAGVVMIGWLAAIVAGR